MGTADKSIKFPAKHYVGFQARPSVDDVPLGFMTPDGDDSAAKKRKATVDSWAGGNGYYAGNKAPDKLPAQSFDNTPLTGFKLGRNVRHGYGWGQGNVKWRIEDPRGFELEITSPNLAQLMGFCNIEQGEIQEQCIWARLGAENILVPVNSEVYSNTVRNTERLAKKVGMRELNRGDSVVLQNGEEGIYYGAFFVVSITSDRADDQDDGYYSNFVKGQVMVCTGKKRHVFLMQHPGADGMESIKILKALGSPKLSEVFEGERELTHEEAERDINQMMRDGISLSESTTEYYTPIGVSIEEPKQEDFTQVEHTVDLADVITKGKATGKTGWELSYAIGNMVHGVLIGEIGNDKVVFTMRDYLDALERAPGGSHYHSTYASRPDYWMFKLALLDIEKVEETGKLWMKTAVSRPFSGWGGGPKNGIETISIDARQLNTQAIQYEMTMTTAGGSTISYHR